MGHTNSVTVLKVYIIIIIGTTTYEVLACFRSFFKFSRLLPGFVTISFPRVGC